MRNEEEEKKKRAWKTGERGREGGGREKGREGG